MSPAGPFIGPHGGKWADPEHTIPWRPGVHFVRGVAVASPVTPAHDRDHLGFPRRPGPLTPAEERENARQRGEVAAHHAIGAGHIEFEHHQRPGLHAALLPDASHPGKFRFSEYDAHGFARHETHPTREAAARAMVRAGYHHPSPGALDRLAAGEEWAAGERANTINRLHNELGSGHEAFRAAEAYYLRHGRTEAAFDTIMRHVGAIRGGTVPDELHKGGGPYIGPRGGKWADPEHTIPWHSDEGREIRQTSLLPEGEAPAHKPRFQPANLGAARGVVERHGFEVPVSQSTDQLIEIHPHKDAARALGALLRAGYERVDRGDGRVFVALPLGAKGPKAPKGAPTAKAPARSAPTGQGDLFGGHAPEPSHGAQLGMFGDEPAKPSPSHGAQLGLFKSMLALAGALLAGGTLRPGFEVLPLPEACPRCGYCGCGGCVEGDAPICCGAEMAPDGDSPWASHFVCDACGCRQEVRDAYDVGDGVPTFGRLVKAIRGTGAERAGHKYVRRVPKPGGGWRYFYSDSASARSATAGEDVNVGGKITRVHAVGEHGVEIEDEDGRRTLSHDEWAGHLAAHWGDRYHEFAERKAKSLARAVAKHVPEALLRDLKGETDAERFADLKRRAPDLAARLEKVGITPEDARRAAVFALGRRGWEPGARHALVGSIFDNPGSIARLRTTAKYAENLAKKAGAERVEAAHVGAAVSLPTTPAGLRRALDAAHADLARARQEVERARAQRPVKGASKATREREAAGQGDLVRPRPPAEEQGGLALPEAPERPINTAPKPPHAALLHTLRTLHSLGALDTLASADPSLRDDPAVQTLARVLGFVQASAPREPGATTTKGTPTTLYVAGADGRAQPMAAEWTLAEADDLTPSHDPVTFEKNAGHDVGNERAYHRDKSEQLKVIGNAQNLAPDIVVNTNPDGMNGAPVVDERGVVLGGNSRTMSMIRAYKAGTRGAALKDYLKENAGQFGFRPEDVEGMKAPILVRKVQPKDMDEKRLLVRSLNEGFTQSMDPRTMAVAVSRRLTPETLASLATNMQPDQTLSEFFDGHGGGEFIGALRRAGIITPQNENAYISAKGRSKGKLNDQGKSLVENVLVGHLVGDADLMSDMPQSLVSSLARVAPYMIQAEHHGGVDLKDQLHHALTAHAEIRDAGLGKTPAENLSRMRAWADQGNMYETPAVLQKGNEAGRELLHTLLTHSGPVQLANVGKRLAEQAVTHSQAAGDLFGVPKPDAAEMIRRARGEAPREAPPPPPPKVTEPEPPEPEPGTQDDATMGFGF